MKEEKHMWNVLHETSNLKHGQIYVPRNFQRRMKLEDGDKLDIQYWERDDEIRIRKIRTEEKRVVEEQFPPER